MIDKNDENFFIKISIPCRQNQGISYKKPFWGNERQVSDHETQLLPGTGFATGINTVINFGPNGQLWLC
ncbi:MAG: hypothetical protein JXA03_06990 [Bacteroidales bacterium]|nr:hypothetical protein [Bacteroidales bacterium]